MTMPTVGCGERTWPNIESVILEASRTLEEARMFRRIILALASTPGGLRVDIWACHDVSDDDTLAVAEDHSTNELVITATRR
jgi:hypothetical protein